MTGKSDIQKFSETLEKESESYGVKLAPPTISSLETYYELLNEWNARLHLVALCSGAEFARRHVLESLFLLSHFPAHATVVDVGSGAGLPILPCLIARDDLHATLIESSKKKAVFLREVLKATRKAENAIVLAERFEQVGRMKAEFLTCRALDRFEEQLDKLIRWAPSDSELLFYGGKSVGKKLAALVQDLKTQLLPNSQQRFLFIASAPR